MKPTPKNVVFHNLVGREVEVLQHPDETLVGLKGLIVGETKNFLIVRREDGSKAMVQKLGYFKLVLPGGREVVVSGHAIRGRPEDRLKRFAKR